MRLLKHREIDKVKWDKLVASVKYAPFYFLYDYLSTICKWEAVVIEKDGEYVMGLPLPFKKKLWLKYFYQPFFCQQLGVLNLNKMTLTEAQELKKLLKKEFSFGYAQWIENEVVNHIFEREKRVNFVVDLNHSYSQLQLNYNSNRKRTLNKLKTNSYEITNHNSSEKLTACIGRFESLFTDTISEIKTEHYSKLNEALEKISSVAQVLVKNVIQEKKVISSGLFVEFNSRIVYLLGFTEPDYRKQSAQSLLFDDLISENEETDKILDLEGGSSSGIGQFYRSLGGIEKQYSMVSVNSNHLIFRKIFE